MSHSAAQHLASYGRGPDTELVHMSKDEVKGLQALAMAHGGNLTINPHTGLAEAGFLTKILPMVAGAALAATGVGAPMAALMVGGAYGAMTGSLTKGLMAGLGAWGGAGLGAGLAEAGAENLVSNAGADAVQKAALESGTQLAPGTAQAGTEAALTPQQIQASNFLNQTNLPNMTGDQISQLRMDALNAQNPLDVARSAGMGNVAQSAQVANPSTMQSLANMGRGLPQIGSVISSNAPQAFAAVAPALMTDPRVTGAPTTGPDQYDLQLAKYRMSPNYQAYEAPRPNPYYRAQYAMGGEVKGLQMGGQPAGPVERMSDNVVGSGGMYPQSQQEHTNFATPTQMPASAEVIRSDYDAKTNPYTGDMVTMASGGIAGYANKGEVKSDYMDPLPESVGVPRTGIYRDPDVDTARKDALTAAMIRLGKVNKGAGIKPIALPKTSIKGLGDISGATPDTTEAAAGGTMRYNLGGYSDGGRMLKGPGDGMSDSIPATISGKQPARLADGEFVVPADVVSHLGNGSTDAGAKKLYGMMDKIRKARTGKKKQAPAVKANKFLPA